MNESERPLQAIWTAVDDYAEATLQLSDPVLRAALEDNAAARLPPIGVTATQGRLLYLLARVTRARAILEIGTLGGYSTIWLARALEPDGRLITLEAEPEYAAVAQANIARAGLSQRVEVRVGRALDTLPRIHAEGLGPFDLVFVDADKPTAPGYVEWALKLSRPGTIVIVDNVVRDGAIIDSASGDPRVQGMRAAVESIASNSRFSATLVQTVGSKGYDGFIIGVVDSFKTSEPPDTHAT